MISYKMWKARRKDGFRTVDTWLREGWFLFGFIPLYTRDYENREKLWPWQ